ncbi:type I-B CRISPR-associated endonuclease Cas1b [Anaerobranca gottschalkii]|uniref:CRISPR-associated endonuclease Cas1 n=1 Tax=Anaerobranca gottschalkii DSM 13577 TaxID=1120990 RepID=A0A1I0A8Q4_9FIRM|nr:type I-B CRISPR-associated endonuclease Cas1b [Anaerobranca gottschalkii]SES90548.1 CRISP-associated protein Cas1 [Anaerobranca gottschalkii DSM 13577]
MKKNIYVFNDGEISRKDNTILFQSEAGRKVLPVEDISSFFFFGEVTLNKKFLEFVSQKEIILHFFNYYGYYTGSYYPREHYNSGYMILKQAEHYLDKDKRIKLARSFVLGSSRNMLSVIRYYLNRGKELRDVEDNILGYYGSIAEYDSTDELMGIEGNIRETYYKAFDKIIEDENFRFEQRTKRPPKNHLNALISFGNSMLYTTVLGEIYKTHLDPRIGYLHSTNFRRFTLNLDVAEIFKPLLVDRLIFYLLSKKMIQKKHFDNDLGGIMLKEEGKRIFVEEFDKRLKTTIQHKELGRSISYRWLIRMELYKLEKHLLQEKEYIPFVSKW